MAGHSRICIQQKAGQPIPGVGREDQQTFIKEVAGIRKVETVSIEYESAHVERGPASIHCLGVDENPPTRGTEDLAVHNGDVWIL
jgi:hypothetical protein